jgi:general stress protein YciG
MKEGNMADNFNPADNLSQEARSEGGQKVSQDTQHMSEIGKKGAKAQSKEDKRKGGERSHDGGR